ncbi:MAG: 2-C-methyl-D-erythritol 2,4-cyclodiphosphate synthase [Porticoccaceae bacterium]|jgi:2-C-methyl-D-erythritol 2,4-cyclodiphosphate synthase|nr:2-C-methyl-D-erythritol 2,4-cyclodiphosphate synthase [Porticoccaceae bacterium]MDG1485981.1 2-C-methyl-D-erythritol 2,4-cyclodiphosphate synthase [Porticoccaceae bacterium]
MRIGHGYDVHAFGEGDGLVLGGVKIPYQRAFIAHSDGDVLIHALIDSLLGAMALGDIGQHFPDTDPAYAGCDSRTLLVAVAAIMKDQGYQLGNADISIIAQHPKMAPHLQAMRDNLAADLSCDIGQINIKATTTEKLGFAGRGEGIACHAVALLQSAGA